MITRSIEIMVFCLAALAMPAGCRFDVPIECDGCALQCGNGRVDPGEECDDGNKDSGDGCNATCAVESCGNGIVDMEAYEQCDDGNTEAGDGCSPVCKVERCGNSVEDPGELCDDGNTMSGDGCSADCQSDEICGNGILDWAAGEACDDGNVADGDGCRSTCALPSCGDGIMDPGEACDDGNDVSGDGCNATCTSDETCGNGMLDSSAGEACDDGNTVAGDGCSPSCTVEFCGSGVVDPGEVCDDGDTTSGNGCSSDCQSDETCGNGILDWAAGEACDDGNVVDGDGCQGGCALPGCGDGIIDMGEACDDGDNVSGDGCNASCTSDESCGNGVVDSVANEECDDGNGAAGDGCTAECKLEYCGNSVTDSGEVCDDGNNVAGDGCSTNCQSDETCGNGIVDGSKGEQCDEGDVMDGDGCSALCKLEYCGNNVTDPGEACDDGNHVAGDRCAADCRVESMVVAGGEHTCALLETGTVRCWGYGASGRLGYGNTNDIGDNETPASAGDVDVGGAVIQFAAGGAHTCALLTSGAVRCWGYGYYGQLGYGYTSIIGDNETPSSAGDVDVGGTVIQLVAGASHTCALLGGGAVRCWGYGNFGRLGYGNTNDIGDDETPSSEGNVDVGGTVIQLAAGGAHTCALLASGTVRCWGYGYYGQLGYGNTNSIGDDEAPASAGDVDAGGAVIQLAAGEYHTCALLMSGAVRCWGLGSNGQLGYGATSNIGDNETPASAGDVDVGGVVIQLAAGDRHTCALLASGAVRCWGLSSYGRLGYGNSSNIGDNETPASAGDVDVGGAVIQLAAGDFHTCARLADGAVRCWGWGDHGRLGYGNQDNIGDNETPASAGDVPYL